MKQILVLIAALCSGCALLPGARVPEDYGFAAGRSDERIALFSSNPVGGLPSYWDPLILFRSKKQTRYQLVADRGETVLHSHAAGSSSGLMQHVNIDPVPKPWLRWQWKVGSMAGAMVSDRQTNEDAPARVILGFDGDKDSLPFSDQILFETARVFTGYDFPYATLMYVWDTKAPVGAIITSNRSERIKMLVVANAFGGVGEWHTFTRNIVADFEKAFGEKPGKLIGVGVLTDTDGTGATVDTWYGDIQLRRELN